MYLEQFFTKGLGCFSYLVGCEAEGLAAVIDPDRDIGRYVDAAAARGLTITDIIETHLHADHVSGNIALASRTGAPIYIHKDAGVGFEHRPLADGDTLTLGKVKIRILHSPGHTPESVILLVSDTTRSDQPWLALTGDTLFVGDVGRPDLVGPDRARELAGHMHDSLFGKLLRHEDGLLIYPGHGAGSLCGRSIGSMRSTTLGFERRFNPAMLILDRGEFVEQMTRNLPQQPGNHQYIKALNKRGAEGLGAIMARGLSVEESIPYFQRGVALLDTRSREAYANRHIPGSVNLAADEQLSNRVGFVLPPNEPIILLIGDEQDYEEIVLSLARVGYDQVLGYLVDGIRGWTAAGLPVTTKDIEDLSVSQLNRLLHRAGNEAVPDSLVVLDVREPWEFQEGHVPGAKLMPLGALPARVQELDAQTPVAVICETGVRSQSAAAFLGRQGFHKVYNVLGGTSGWRQAGYPVSVHDAGVTASNERPPALRRTAMQAVA